MTNVANTDVTNNASRLRPQDATTLEEFQARRDAGLAAMHAERTTVGQRFRLDWFVWAQMACAALWVWFWQTPGSVTSGSVRGVILALAATGNTVVVVIAVIDAARRRRELNRLGKQ